MKAKKIISTILVIGIIGVFIVYKVYNKPHVNVANKKAYITLTANKIIEEFSSDETIANAKYLEKIIQVNGIVSSIEVEKEIAIITLETNNDFGSVICYLTAEGSNKIAGVKKGQKLALKGICTGFLMDVILVKGIIIN